MNVKVNCRWCSLYLLSVRYSAENKKKKEHAYWCSYSEMVGTVGERGHREAPNVLIPLRNKGETPISHHMLHSVERRAGQGSVPLTTVGDVLGQQFLICCQNSLQLLKGARMMWSQAGWPRSANKQCWHLVPGIPSSVGSRGQDPK